MPTAQIIDGQIVESASQNSLRKTGSGNSMDKDAFLQLLVAQMKYQDPMEPTSNTEYVAQYAQFSQVEQMQNMSGNLSLQRAGSMVGKEVVIETTGSNGKVTTVQGRVDFVKYENNKAFLSIDGALYSIDDVKNIVDREYLDAYDKAVDFVSRIGKLPKAEKVTLDEDEEVQELLEQYEKMSSYEKSFIAGEFVTKLKELETKIGELKKTAGEEKPDEPEEPEEPEKPEET